MKAGGLPPALLARSMVELVAALLLGFAAIAQAGALERSESGPAAAQEQKTSRHEEAEREEQAPGPQALPAAAATSHSLELPGRTLRFKAIAGPVHLRDAQTGAPQADIATAAFILEDTDAAKRPITFVINGGPGAASAWLNLGSLGPWRLPLDRPPYSPSAVPAPTGNADTWLDFTDLVFIDPPGTGYSRILAKGDESRRHFYSVDGDIEALAVIIRKWLAANRRLESPKFIVGESYGGFRGPKLVRRLEEHEGIGIAGLVLISPVLDFGWHSDTPDNPLAAAARLPSQAAAARGLTGPDPRSALGDAEDYAAGPYIVDLLKGERDTQALARMSEKVAAFTGLDPALVRKLGGRIDNATFARERGRAAGKVASAYDALISGYDPFPHSAVSEYADPVVDAVKAGLATAMANITADRLNWSVEGRYEILNESVARAWEWGSGRRQPESLSDLKKAMALDPSFRVLVAHGVTDQVTPYFASKLLIDQVPQMGSPNRLRLKVYGGGHMLYFEDKSRAALREDARKLIEGK